jgi:hypothetical protein
LATTFEQSSNNTRKSIEAGYTLADNPEMYGKKKIENT